jgi:hypothetical protein
MEDDRTNPSARSVQRIFSDPHPLLHRSAEFCLVNIVFIIAYGAQSIVVQNTFADYAPSKAK